MLSSLSPEGRITFVCAGIVPGKFTRTRSPEKINTKLLLTFLRDDKPGCLRFVLQLLVSCRDMRGRGNAGRILSDCRWSSLSINKIAHR